MDLPEKKIVPCINKRVVLTQRGCGESEWQKYREIFLGEKGGINNVL